MGNRQQEENRVLTFALSRSEGKSVRGGSQKEIERVEGNGNQAGILECDLGGLK